MQVSPDDEVELVAQAQAGRSAAFAALVVRYRDRAWATANRILRDPAAADDATQDAFERAYRQLGTLQGRFWPWMAVIVHHAAVDLGRRRRPDRPTPEELDPDQGTAGAQVVQQAPALVDQHRLGAQLYAALSALDEIHRAVLVLREVDGLTYEDMAIVLDVPEGTIMSRLWNARQKARAQLRDYKAARLAG